MILVFSACGTLNRPNGTVGQEVMENQAVQVDVENTLSENHVNEATQTPSPQEPDVIKPTIVCTIFPHYDWTRQILGERVDDFNLVLLGNRIDLHNYQPSIDDIVTITASDLFIYNGGKSDGWVMDVLKNAVNPDMMVVNLLEALFFADGADVILSHGHDDDFDDGHSGCGSHQNECDEDIEINDLDEHIWLSLTNAAFLSRVITNNIIKLDPDHRDIYEANLSEFLEQISTLKTRYHEAVNNADNRTLVFADRFPFRYLIDEYNLKHYSAFPGCSAETEASFDTIIFLAGKIDTLGLTNVVVTESSDQSIAATIINATSLKDQTIYVLDSLQSLTSTEAGLMTYLDIMERNLTALMEILR